MAIEFRPSAYKHRCTEKQIVYAMLNHYTRIQGFDQAREPDLPDPDLWIGPSGPGLADPVLEVFSNAYPPKEIVVFHAMELRDKTDQRATAILNERGGLNDE